MTCRVVKGGDAFGAAIVCSRGARRSAKCSQCGEPAERLCDFPSGSGPRHRTCDAPLCERCTTRLPGGGDLCKHHATEWQEKLGRREGGR